MWIAAAQPDEILIGWVADRKKVLLAALAVLLLSWEFSSRKPSFCTANGFRAPSAQGINAPIGGTAGDLLDVWKLAFRHIQERPFPGIGFGRSSFTDAFPEFRAQHQPLLWHAHNTLLDFTFQTGIQG